MAKKSKSKKGSARGRGRRGVASPATRTAERRRGDLNVPTTENDNFSFAVDDLVPEDKQGTSRYLDVVQWNLEWFGAGGQHAEFSRKRLPMIIDILDALNGDLFILQEIAGPTRDGRREGALDVVAQTLTQRDAGAYVVDYTHAGGQQRVAMMWDTDVLKARTEVEQLFPQGTHKLSNGKDAFATRTPLYGYFKARPINADGSPGSSGYFEFQALGVHLKAMADGAEQREEFARVLVKWMRDEAPLVDADVMIMGDFNAPPNDPCWRPFHQLENDGKAKFQSINDPSDFSYLWLENTTSKFVSKLTSQCLVLRLRSASSVTLPGRCAGSR